MQRQGSGVVKETAYQRWKKSGEPRPYLKEVIAVERFDFFALASLLLAVVILGWWIYSIYKVAFPEPKKIPVTYSYSARGSALFGVPTQTPTPMPPPTPTQPPLWGGPRAGGTHPGGTRPGGTHVGWALMGIGLALFISSFLTGYSISKKYKIAKKQ